MKNKVTGFLAPSEPTAELGVILRKRLLRRPPSFVHFFFYRLAPFRATSLPYTSQHRFVCFGVDSRRFLRQPHMRQDLFDLVGLHHKRYQLHLPAAVSAPWDALLSLRSFGATINDLRALNSNPLSRKRWSGAVAKESLHARSFKLTNPNAGIHAETAAVGIRLHSFSVTNVNVAALHERS
jgi:hypothetical protein